MQCSPNGSILPIHGGLALGVLVAVLLPGDTEKAELSPEQLTGSCSSKDLFNPFLLSTAGSRSGNESGKLQKEFSGASFRK